MEATTDLVMSRGKNLTESIRKYVNGKQSPAGTPAGQAARIGRTPWFEVVAAEIAGCQFWSETWSCTLSMRVTILPVNLSTGFGIEGLAVMTNMYVFEFACVLVLDGNCVFGGDVAKV